jgi:DNA-binding response OmpR family regulator
MDKILVVDDDKTIQLLYAEELEEEGYHVITTGEGSKVMELLKQKKPDLIVLDIKLGHLPDCQLSVRFPQASSERRTHG